MNDEPCGKCMDCHLIAAGNHPDLIVLEPSSEEPASPEGEATSQKKAKVSQFITVAQVRSLLDRLELVTHGGKGRVVIADPAEQLNGAAANALLKTLEDPPSLTTFLLITSQEERLPITLRSRCRRVPVPCPARGVSLDWLQSEGVDNAQALLRLAGGAPLKARAMGESGVTQRWDRLVQGLTLGEIREFEWDTTAQGLAELCHFLQMLCIDLNRMREGAGTRYLPEEGSPLRETAMGLWPETISDVWMDLNKTKALIRHPLNGALVRDELLLSFDRLIAQRTP